MVALSVFEKYPDSFRLDHADFPEVCRTTFALGVISDFKQIANDPIQVSPLVKVKIEGMEESDFIPLFFQAQGAVLGCARTTRPRILTRGQCIGNKPGSPSGARMRWRCCSRPRKREIS